MPRKGENIYKRKDGRWEARYIKSYSAEGKARYGYIYSRSYAEVKMKQNIAIVENRAQSTETSILALFSQIANKWLEHIKVSYKISTYNKYRNNYEKQIDPYLGKYPISKISGEMIDNYIKMLFTNGRNDGTPFSPKTVQDICMEIKQIFKFAEENYRIKAQFLLSKLSIKHTEKKIAIINPSDMHCLCRYLLENPTLYKIGILLAIYTGIRLGELCAIKWEDISFDDGVLKITKTVQRIQQLDNSEEKTKLVILSAKTSCSNRSIPLPISFLSFLKTYKGNNDHYMLSGSNKIIDPRTVQYHFKKCLKECDIKSTNFHAIRHTFATHCVELGFDIKTLSEILGHSSVNITLDRYVHSSMKTKQESMNKLIVEF